MCWLPIVLPRVYKLRNEFHVFLLESCLLMIVFSIWMWNCWMWNCSTMMFSKFSILFKKLLLARLWKPNPSHFMFPSVLYRNTPELDEIICHSALNSQLFDELWCCCRLAKVIEAVVCTTLKAKPTTLHGPCWLAAQYVVHFIALIGNFDRYFTTKRYGILNDKRWIQTPYDFENP